MNPNGWRPVVIALILFALAFTLVGGGLGHGLIIILVGPPASGKTTQANYLRSQHHIQLISAETILAKAYGQKPKYGKELRAMAASDELLSDDATNAIVLQQMKKADFSRGFVLDGYPSTRAQVAFLENTAQELQLEPPVAIVLDVPDEVARQRMLRRGRANDDPASIDSRLAAYHRQESFIRENYPAGRVLKVDGTGNPGDIARAIEKALRKLYPPPQTKP